MGSVAGEIANGKRHDEKSKRQKVKTSKQRRAGLPRHAVAILPCYTYYPCSAHRLKSYAKGRRRKERQAKGLGRGAIGSDA